MMKNPENVVALRSNRAPEVVRKLPVPTVIVYAPPMWPTVDNSGTNFRVLFEPFNIVVTPTIEAGGPALGSTGVGGERTDHLDLGAFGLTNGVVYAKCLFDGSENITDVELYASTTGIPADSSTFFHVPTHVYYSYESAPSSGVFVLSIRPLYFGSLRPIRCSNDFWRW